jgi:hypothetical protein
MSLQRVVLNVAAVCGISAAACWAAPTGTATWSPNKALLGQLAPATKVSKYQIQPPQSYTIHAMPGPAGISGDAWVGLARPDGTRPYIMLAFFTPPAGEKNRYTLKQFGAKMLAGIERRRKSWKQSSTEQGIVNGLTFLRTRWQGMDALTGQPMYGFSYVAKDANVFVQLSSQDFAPYKNPALSLAEASALTFKKQ